MGSIPTLIAASNKRLSFSQKTPPALKMLCSIFSAPVFVATRLFTAVASPKRPLPELATLTRLGFGETLNATWVSKWLRFGM
jgi:hypothetical protein